MDPISFDGCFGWLHTSQLESRDTGVVICPGLKTDHLTGYGGLRLLAEALADRGFPTLRLDYPGTGNAVEPDTAVSDTAVAGAIGAQAVEYWQIWQRSVHHATEWLHDHCGSKHVVLIGFRFGALLAASVTVQRSDVVGLVLLAPVLRGRSYLRQLAMEAAPLPDGGIDGGGFCLSPATIQIINQVELPKLVPPPGCRVAIFNSSSPPLLNEAEAHWVRAGVKVSRFGFTGLEAMLRPTFANHESPAVVTPIVTWLREAFPNSLRARPNTRPATTVEIKTDRYIESPLYFGPERTLFGMLCRPVDQTSRTVVLMANASADPHCASAGVSVARHLAAGGVASLRFDFSGIGESAAADGAPTHVFEVDRTSEFSAAINVLQAMGYQHFATEGLCSGAYHAYHAALSDARIGAVLLINLPFFEWIPGFPVEDLNFDIRKPGHFVQMMRTTRFWRSLCYKILRGDINIARRFAWIERRLRKLPSFARDALDAVALAKRARMLFLVSEGDVSTEILRREFGSARPPGTKIEVAREVDHSMSGANMRKLVANHMLAFLHENV
jgi:alpha/beta superfamily hydrolase